MNFYHLFMDSLEKIAKNQKKYKIQSKKGQKTIQKRIENHMKTIHRTLPGLMFINMSELMIR